MGRFKAWFTAGRFFILPLLVSLSFFGVALAGFDLAAWGIAMLVTGLVLIAGHYINDWRDFARGVDRINGGSITKAYTSASQILPRTLLSIEAVQLSATAFLGLSLPAFIVLVPLRMDTVILYCLGVGLAVAYTDLLKPHRGSEVSFFLAIFAVTAFSYSIIKPLDFTGLAAGTIAGMMGVMIHPIDQYPDVKGPVRRVRNLAELIFKSQIGLSGVFWFFVTAIYTMQIGFILLGWLPKETLLSLFTLPVSHITGIFLDYNLAKGALLALLWITLYMILAGLGVLFYESLV